MPRASYERYTCKDCGRNRDEVGHVTWRGYCIDCGKSRHKAETDQLHHHAGPHFEYWRRRMAASVGAALLEDLDALARQD